MQEMRLNFKLLQHERLYCSECDRRMVCGEKVHIIPDKDVVLFYCEECNEVLTKREVGCPGIDGKQAAIVVREYFEGISVICPVIGFQTYSIKRVDDGFDVVCSMCSAIMSGLVKYRAHVDQAGKVTNVEKCDESLKKKSETRVPSGNPMMYGW